MWTTPDLTSPQLKHEVISRRHRTKFLFSDIAGKSVGKFFTMLGEKRRQQLKDLSLIKGQNLFLNLKSYLCPLLLFLGVEQIIAVAFIGVVFVITLFFSLSGSLLLLLLPPVAFIVILLLSLSQLESLSFSLSRSSLLQLLSLPSLSLQLLLLLSF